MSSLDHLFIRFFYLTIALSLVQSKHTYTLYDATQWGRIGYNGESYCPVYTRKLAFLQNRNLGILLHTIEHATVI